MKGVVINLVTIFLAFCLIDFALASRAPVAIPLHISAKSAKAIAVVEVIGGATMDGGNSARYGVRIEEVVRGEISGDCFIGSVGLKIGRKYVMFFRSRNSAVDDYGECGGMSVAGTFEPTAFEIERRADGISYVRLDSRRVIPPKFKDSFELIQSLETKDAVESTIIGTIVPLSTFLEYVTTRTN